MLDTIEEVHGAMEAAKYITDRSTATVLYLSLKLEKPILVEGEAGVGKTEIAKGLAQILKTRLIRLQCYEGLDVNTSLYEWNYPRQILWMKQAEVCQMSPEEAGKGIFSPDFLIRRPLLEAIQNESAKPPVLLIDEIDRSDEEFEAFLLEVGGYAPLASLAAAWLTQPDSMKDPARSSPSTRPAVPRCAPSRRR